MSDRRDVSDYLAGAETVRRRELVWGIVREPPAPFWSHQTVVMRVAALLFEHVTAHRLGQVVPAPVDVVLDEARALVVQPDIVYLSIDRLQFVRNQIWGAPDLVVEVESTGTRQRDRIVKRRWYRHYGVKEYWLVDPSAETVTTFGAVSSARTWRRRRYRGAAHVRSAVFPLFDRPASAFF